MPKGQAISWFGGGRILWTSFLGYHATQPTYAYKLVDHGRIVSQGIDFIPACAKPENGWKDKLPQAAVAQLFKQLTEENNREM